MLLKDKKILVTGGSRGIGKEIVLACLKQGASVYFISRSPSPHIGEMEDTAKEFGGSVHWSSADVSQKDVVVPVVEKILEESGGIDVLINNAGITRDGLFFRMKSEDWQSVLDTNLSSVFYITQPVSRAMIKKRAGSIINISSIVGITGNAGQTNYSAAKAGLIGLSKSLAKETAARGVRVNVIAPGFIATEMTDGLNDKIKEDLKKQIPLGRIGDAKEIADAVLYLASDMSTYLTGQVLRVDGGMGM